MELKRDPLLRVDENVKRVQMRLNNVCSNCPRLVVDGKFGPHTEKAVIEYQKSHHFNPPVLGVVDDATFVSLMNERYTLVTNASPNSKVDLDISSQRYGNIINGTKKVYGNFSTGIGALQTVNGLVDPKEGGFAFIINEWDKAIKVQRDGLLKRLAKFPIKQARRARNVLREIQRCEKYFDELRRYGINAASKVFGNNLTKEQAIKFISDLGKTIGNHKLTKIFGTFSKVMNGIRRILQPILRILNKVPGLKYLSVYEKIVQGTIAMIRFDFDKAFVAYMDGLRLLAEQIIIDAVVVAAVIAGGWVALVIAIAVLAAAFLIDYFLFNDDPENSWLPTTHLTTKIKPAIEQGFNQFRKIEMPWKNENVWRGPSYYMQEQMI